MTEEDYTYILDSLGALDFMQSIAVCLNYFSFGEFCETISTDSVLEDIQWIFQHRGEIL